MKRILFYIVVLFVFSAVSAQEIHVTNPVRYLALGDSYTIGESVKTTQRWPIVLSYEMKKIGYSFKSVDIIARTGWRTDELMEAINRENPSTDYSMVSLLIGVNNQYQGKEFSQFEEEFENLLKMAVKHAGGIKSRVFVVSIPDYAYTPFGQQLNPKKISRELDGYNFMASKICRKYGILFINITPISRKGLDNPGLVASDDLHPSAKQYRLWVDRIIKHLTPPKPSLK